MRSLVPEKEGGILAPTYTGAHAWVHTQTLYPEASLEDGVFSLGSQAEQISRQQGCRG